MEREKAKISKISYLKIFLLFSLRKKKIPFVCTFESSQA